MENSFVLDDIERLVPYAALSISGSSISALNSAAASLFGPQWQDRALMEFLPPGDYRALEPALRERRVCCLPRVDVQGLEFSATLIPLPSRDILVFARHDADRREKRQINFMLNLDQSMRTQLTNLQLSHSALTRALDSGDSEKVQLNLEAFRQMVLRLMRLSGNVRDVARFMQRAEMPGTDTVDIVALCRTLTERCREYAQLAGVELEFSSALDELLIIGDEARLEKLLFNLLSNAFLHGNDGGKAIVSLALEENRVLLSVSDNGKGMDRERIGEVFSSYKAEADMHRAGQKGMGFGLTLVQYIARLHGGFALVDTKPGMGMRVTVSIPYIPGEHRVTLRDTAVDYSGGFDLGSMEMSVLPLPRA